ncbi:hypothetical protein [Kineosporia sp. NBRC 101731]|uniref:hypothetical protein n=1 Tax=Kineosporia sp. NBRC 101731 TaxID=3032199 RepID=UPI002554283E|nr:hypothetical protein [Kineosporia sp. NBRC 101731]
MGVVLGLSADLRDHLSLVSGLWSSHGVTEMSGPYRVIMAGVLVDDSAMDGRDVGDRMEEINQSTFELFEKRMRKIDVGVAREKDFEPQEWKGESERRQYLTRLLNVSNADLAVSILLKPGRLRTTMNVEFLGSSDGDEATELAGFNSFGDETLSGFSSPSTEARVAKAVRSRSESYLTLMRAVSSYGIGEYTDSIEQFTRSQKNLTTVQFQRFSLMMLGNATGRAGDDAQARERAARFFRKSLRLDPSYGRARLGLAEVLFQQALRESGDEEARCSDWPRAQMDQMFAARRAYEEVLASDDRYGIPGVETRARYGMGRADTCLTLAGDETRLKPAIDQLEKVISAYRAQPDQQWLQALASEAHACIALSYVLGPVGQVRWNWAVDHYRQAQTLAVDPGRLKTLNTQLQDLLSLAHPAPPVLVTPLQ